MNTISERLALAAALMLMAGQGFAQTATTATGTAAAGATTPAATTFDRLSPGNQKIARSLFLAQQPTANGPAPLSLNQIAALKGKEGWGEAFKQMKAEGLVDAKTLGQVVSAHEHALHAPVTGGAHTVTAAGGRTSGGTHRDSDESAAAAGGEHHGAATHHDHDDAITIATAGGATSSAAMPAGAAGTHSGAAHGGEARGR